MEMSWKLYPISEFMHLRHAWETLNAGNPATPLLGLASVLPALGAFGTGHELVGRYEDDRRLRAMAIFSPTRRGTWSTFQPSQAPLGFWIHDGKDLDWHRIFAELVPCFPGLALAAGITQQDPLLLPRPANVGALRTIDHITTAGIAIRGTYEDYWAARSKNLRSNLRTQVNKLKKLGIETRLERIEKSSDVAAAIESYGLMESTGWKAKAGTAVHPTNRQGLYYRELFERLYANGTGRIYRYWYNDKPVATHLCVQGDDMFIVLKMAYDESVGNDTSPSLLMLREVFEQVFRERAVTRIESYGKLVEWNSKWYDDVRVLYHITGYRWAALPAIRELRQHRRREISP